MSDTETDPDPVEEATPTRSSFQVHPVSDSDGRTRFGWRLRTGDGDTCLMSQTRFVVRDDARRDVKRVKASAADAEIEDVAS